CSEYLAIHCTSYLSVFVLFPSSLFFLSRYPLPRDLHSFPTRRSSDLMDPQQGRSAAQWLAEAPEEEIAQVIRDYGEEKFARRMARAIVEERARRPLVSTLQLAELVKQANPAWEKHKHPATRAFQAIRIFINDELQDLREVLDASLDVLAPAGRLVVISFH